MENFLSALAFAGLIAAQFLSVVLVRTQRCDDPFPGTRSREKRATPRAGRQGISSALESVHGFIWTAPKAHNR